MKKVFISGGTRGIGKACAKLFYEKGWQVSVCYFHNEKAARDFQKEFPEISVHQADVGNPEDVKKLAGKIGEVDALVNNAGISLIKPIQDVSEEEWKRMMYTTLTGAFHLTKAFLPGFLRKQKGAIVNISSMWGMTGASCEVPYSAAKAGLLGYTKALAKELGPSGIRVNSVSPGLIDTEMNRELSSDTIEELVSEIPLGKMGSPEEVAKAVYFLAQDDSSYITGVNLSVNGGLVIE